MSSRDLTPLADPRPLLGSLRVGDPVGADHELAGVDASAGLTLWLRGPHGGVQVDIFPRSAPQPGVVDTQHFRLSYRGALPTSAGKALCELLGARVATREGDWLRAARGRTLGAEGAQRRVRQVSGGRALELRVAREVSFHALNPYVGCLIGCSFCYAQGQLQPWRALLRLPDVRWGSWVDVRAELPALLRDELLTAPRLPIKVTPVVADPYQAIETKERVTRRCLEVLASTPNPPPVMLSTRSARVLDDVELLAQMSGVWVGMSVPTLDAEICATLEPGASSPQERIEALRRLQSAGVTTFAVAQPMLPGDVRELADALAGVADSVTLDTLHGTYAASPHFASGPLHEAADPAWQRARLDAMAQALAARGVPLWRGELPPALCGEVRDTA